jgi:tetratricopeptide (TPR) repeat protein
VTLDEGLRTIRAARDAGRYDHAEHLARAAIASIERGPGPDAVELAAWLNELGMIGKYRGTFTDAEQAYRRALAIHQQHGETASTSVASLLHNLAGLAHAKGDPPAAEPLARHGIAIRAALAVPDPLALAEDEAALVAILIDLGRLDEADAVLRRLLQDYRRLYGPVHYEIAALLHNLGSLQYRNGDWVRAADTLCQSRDMKIDVLGAQHPDLAITLHNLGCCALKLGDADRARESFRAAIEILQPIVDPSHPTLVSCRTKLDWRD